MSLTAISSIVYSYLLINFCWLNTNHPARLSRELNSVSHAGQKQSTLSLSAMELVMGKVHSQLGQATHRVLPSRSQS
jgi:hypothetical protein